MFEGYQRFRIPPNFDLVQLHKQTSYIYLESSKPVEICPCCQKLKKQKLIPFCVGTSKLVQLGQQIPMLFYFLKATSIFLLFVVLAKFGDYQICNAIQGQCPVIYAKFQIPQVGIVSIPAGFKQTNETLMFVQFLIFVIGIIVLKISIKIKKYLIIKMTRQSISNRTLKLINVHKQSTVKQIKQALFPYQVQVVLTYKVKQFQECLTKINRLLKMKKLKQQKKGSFIKQDDAKIEKNMANLKDSLKRIKRQLKFQENRLSIVFVIFNNSQQKKQAYLKFKRSLPSRLFYKLCTCFSDTAIRGQSFTVKPADDPSDIIWPNLQNRYLSTKCRRFLSIFVCFTLLIFGVATEYLFTQLTIENSFIGPLVKSGVVLVLNYFIVALLEYSTQHMEHYQSHTQRHLTLVQKMTSFLFINISLSPLLGYYFSLQKQQQKQETIRQNLFANFCFSVLVLAIGNISKPFPLWLSVQRVIKALGKWLNKRKGHQCILTQIQANKQFQPIQFPISTFYSLSLSSLLMVCFYVNSFQSIILIEMISLVLLYVVGKWMLLRVCKSPAGLARRISNLAQSLLRIVIFIYWLGKILLAYINLNEGEKDRYDSIFGYIFRNAYGYIEFILAILCILFLQFFVAWISRWLLKKFYKGVGSNIPQSGQKLIDTYQQYFEISYANANLNLKLQQQYQKYENTYKQILRRQRQKKKRVFR